MRPAPMPQAVDQVDFMALACASMTLYEFMLFPGTYRGHTGKFFFYLLFLLASSSKGFVDWCDPLLCTNLADWWHSPDFVLLCFVLVIYFTLRLKFPHQYRGARRT